MSRFALPGAFLSGLLFAIGLGVAGMTRPEKVLAFLDVAGGTWDPSLGLVMVGAIAVHLPFHRWMKGRGRASGALPPVVDCGIVPPPSFDELAPIGDGSSWQPESPATNSINGGALTSAQSSRPWAIPIGAALFGVGWGLAGYCPGPALVSLVSLSPGILLFVAAMAAGMILFARLSPGTT